ncbi:phosphomannomutase/phosphoglucomutase [Candidatus Saccharibacteria bacterium]|nr:phosphomannomutase/phosphoglucomutase [Candidatus Saccharibacteria bacterium]MCB9817696.1 phosphomannomutase/phosphoglucomutase [Candidatus Nomurabacteria bacterium]
MQEILDEIFKAYDIRGKVGTELTPEVVEKIGYIFSNWLQGNGAIAVGRDMRPDSAELANALINGVRKSGRDVIDIGQVTSDMIYFAVGNYHLAGGAMITASHNPGEYNGIKLCKEEARPIGVESGLLDIKNEVLALTSLETDEYGNCIEKDITEDWINHVLGFVNTNKLKPLKIAVDAGNGMAGKIFPELEPYVPFDVHEMFFELDGTFPNHIANPLEPKNLVDIKKAISAYSCDAGIAFDGDGDRAVLIDETGEALTGTVLTALLADYFLQKNPGATILYNAICGKAAANTIENNGGKAIRTKVGHSYIKADMRKHAAVMAGEHSGHYYFKDNYYADSGLIAAVIGLYVLSTSGKTLSALAAPYRRAYVQIPETNFEVTNKEAVLLDIKTAYAGKKIDELDGITVQFDSGWFNVRASNTEPLLRLNAEAKTQQELDAMVKKVTKIIKA